MLALSGACRTIRDDDWRFRLSREAYPELEAKMEAGEPVLDAQSLASLDHAGPIVLLVIPLILAGPLILDVVFLPVTATRDALVD